MCFIGAICTELGVSRTSPGRDRWVMGPGDGGRVCVCGLLADISRIKPLKPGNTKELEKKLKIILAFRARYKLFTELIKLVWNFSLKISLIN